MRERKRKVFGFIENGLWENEKRKPRSKKGKAPFKDRFLLFEMERREQEGGAVTGVWAPHCPAGPPQEDSCSQHFGLKETLVS